MPSTFEQATRKEERDAGALNFSRDTTHQAADGAKRPHVLYIIDEICELGGAERALMHIVRRLSPDRFRASVVSFRINAELDILQDLPCPLHVLPLRRTYDINALTMALRLRHLIRREKVSIVHTFFETSDLWAAPIAKLSGCPVLISSRRDMGILRSRKHKVAYRAVNPLFDKVLAVSNQVRSYCLRHDRLPKHKVETIYNGVSNGNVEGKETARGALELSCSVPIISTVANIRPVKGIDVLVRAAAQVCREFPAAVFLIAGAILDRDAYVQLQGLAESYGLSQNIRFLGKQLDPQRVLEASDIFCLPSRSEGFSNALVEAMASGLPCVATRVGGNAEAIDEGLNGYLVESEDADALAKKILRLISDSRLRLEMGTAAREKAERSFSIQATVSRLMQIYDELLAAKHA